MKIKTMTVGVVFAVLTIMIALVVPTYAAPPAPPPGPTLDPLLIPQFVNQLYDAPPVYVPTNVVTAPARTDYTVYMTKFRQQILPRGTPLIGNPDGKTWVWGYGGTAKNATTQTFLGYVESSPGPTFEAVRGIPINVTWVTNINTPHMFAVDPTLHWSNPNGMPMMPPMPWPAFPPGWDAAQYNVSLVPHLHGGETHSTSDGYPLAWFTWNGLHGENYSTASPTAPNAAVFYYNNSQPPTTLWYHDHALGITRLNVMSGLAGFYLLRDPLDPVSSLLPTGKWEIPLAIQDRSFNNDGEFWFPNVGINPMDHPYWMPEFFGTTIMVNGKVWPNLNVDRGWYRFRLLDGSNARFYTLTIVNPVTKTLLPFYQIGSDGGYLKAPVVLTTLTISPGERADILVDFSNIPQGTKFIVRNTAKAPFPSGAPPDPRTVGRIMQFTVTGNTGFQSTQLPPAQTPLNPTLPTFPTLTPTIGANGLPLTRTLTLWEHLHPVTLTPLEVLLNGQKWGAVITETPSVGTTEDWMIVDLTMDTHPIHLHLVQFQVISRQKINVNAYKTAWLTAQQKILAKPPWNIANAMPPWPLNFTPVEVPVGPYLIGQPKPAPPNEQGWKDTVQMNPSEVTTIRVRYTPLDAPATVDWSGTNLYPFDPTTGPGYVWHCHIIDHEDNEMMRPYKVVKP